MAYVTQPAYDEVTQSTLSLCICSLRTRTEKAKPADEQKTEREPVCRRLCIKGLVNKYTGGRGGGRSIWEINGCKTSDPPLPLGSKFD